jgi:hypothetical protein
MKGRRTTMATRPKAVRNDVPLRFADKRWVRRKIAEVNQRMGFVPDPDATPQKARELMVADGVRPEENIFSREIMRMRYGDDWEAE